MSSRFCFLKTPISGLHVLQRQRLGDKRGFLERLFCNQELNELTSGKEIVQINHTLTECRGTVRGMHFQYQPHAEMKLISCLKGKVFDVAVDLRRNSPTFLQWHAEILSAENHKSLAIPEGFAHGFQTLSDDCELIYLHTAAYEPNAEGGLHPQDSRMSIQWPLPVHQLSPRDSAHPLLNETFTGVDL